MERFVYLLTILAGISGVAILRRRYLGQMLQCPLARAILATVPLFLLFDLVGSWRGWFSSNPHLNILIVPPGIPLEEPILLAFLAFLSVSLWQFARRLVH